MSELQIQHAAVAFHQGERIKLAFVAGIIEGAEVAPVDLAAFAGARLHTYEGTRRWLGPNLADVLGGSRRLIEYPSAPPMNTSYKK